MRRNILPVTLFAQQQHSHSFISRRTFSEMVVKKTKLKKAAIVNPTTGRTELVEKPEQQSEELVTELRIKRDVKIDNKKAGLVESALDNVNKITFTKEYVVQQSGTPDIRGEVIGVNSAGVPMVRRTPDVARPTLFTTDAEITDSYFDLPDGFNRERFYLEVMRENWPMISYVGLGVASYWYYWPQLYGWPLTLSFITAVQAFSARYGGGSMAMRKTDRSNHPLVLPDKTLVGKICLVTGASSGVGMWTVIGLARRGADVLCGGKRDESAFWKSLNAALAREKSLSKDQKEEVVKRIQYQAFDISEYHSIRGFVDFAKDRLYLHAKAIGRIPVAPASSLSVDGEEKANSENKKDAKTKTKIDIRKEREAQHAQQQELLRQFPPPLDILVNNAATLTNTPKYNSLNVEMMLATNVLGPMFLTELLLPNIRAATKHVVDDWREGKGTDKKKSDDTKKENSSEGGDKDNSTSKKPKMDPLFLGKAPSPFGRVVNVSSMAHVSVNSLGNVQKNLLQRTFDKANFNFNKRYSLTKLLNIYYSDGLARRGVRAVSCTPGGVASSFFRDVMPSIQEGHWAHYPALTLLRTPKEGANTLLVAALAKPDNGTFVPGMMYQNCNKREHSKSAVAMNDREREEFLDWARGQLPIKGFDVVEPEE